MMIKKNYKKIKDFTNKTFNSPFSSFYKLFFFVPYCALEHMYYGLSSDSKYFSFDLHVKQLKKDFSFNFFNFSIFTPKPNIYIPSEFKTYLSELITAKRNFIGIKPYTFPYNFFLGLFLYFIWKLGGGYRISPLYDPNKYYNSISFYDLKFTPLSSIFRFYFKIGKFFNVIDKNKFSDYYVYNSRSLTRGYLVNYGAYRFNNKLNFINFFLFPILTFFPDFFFSIFFHFFFRSILYYYLSFSGKFLTKYKRKNSIFDIFWSKLYLFYIDDILRILRIKNPDFKLKFKIRYQSFIIVFFSFQKKQFFNIRTKILNRFFFSKFSYSDFNVDYAYASKFYSVLENKKINFYKDLIVTDSFSNFKHNFKSVNFSLSSNSNSHIYVKLPLIASSYIEIHQKSIYNFIKKFYSNKKFGTSFLFLRSIEPFPKQFKFNFYRAKYFSFPSWTYINIVPLYQIWGIIYLFFKKFKIFYFNFFFYFNSYLFCFLSFLSNVTNFINFKYFNEYFYKKIKNFIVKFNTTFFIFFYIYFEIRYFFIFVLDYFKYFKFYFDIYYYYYTFYSYWGMFKKFFISSKFFRFFTREIGEDFEEIPYNNVYDFEDYYFDDFISEFSGYYDVQNNSFTFYDEAYGDTDFNEQFVVAHYYDYWFPNDFSGITMNSSYPNMEFFSEDDWKVKESSMFFQVISFWFNPALISFQSNFTNKLPYEAKDKYDFSGIKHNDWFPLELTQTEEYEEGDQLEYFYDSSYDNSTYINNNSMIIIPFDSDRARLNKFLAIYNDKLEGWYKYQINRNFYKLPVLLQSTKFSSVHVPKTINEWQESTYHAAKFFITKKDLFKITNSNTRVSNLPIIEKIWERISYEIDRNPHKLYDYLTSNYERSDIFSHNFNFSFFSKEKIINFFSIKDSNLLDFFSDFFLNRADLSKLSFNKNYSYAQSLNKYDILYSLFYFKFIANRNFNDFYIKLRLLSDTTQFKGIQTVYDSLCKHELEKIVLVSNDQFIEYIKSNYISWYTKATRIPTFEQYRTFWSLFFDFTAKFRFVKNKKKYFFARTFFGKYIVKKAKSVRWIRTWKGFQDRHYIIKYGVNYDRSNSTYENLFSVFFEEKFYNIKSGIFKPRFFKDYKVPGLLYFMIDGEDRIIRYKEAHFDKFKIRTRSYFSYDQVIEGELWSIFNPTIEKFFYELYYLNTNIFFSSNFSNNVFEDTLNDDLNNSGQDIYDDYIYIGGDDFFEFRLGGREHNFIGNSEYYDDDPETLDSSDESFWESSEEWFTVLEEGDSNISRGHELGSEHTDGYLDRYWVNDDRFFYNEHVDSDEGLEEWEPNEYDAFSDLDLSIDRIFFGGLKRKNTFPATDQRVFFGSFSDGPASNLDIDLNYKKFFDIAKKNNDATQLIFSSFNNNTESNLKNFSFFSYFKLAIYRFSIYVFVYLQYTFNILFFMNFTNFNISNNVKFYGHYIKWYTEYNFIFSYKHRVEDWLNFFESFRDFKTFVNFKDLNVKNFISEPQNTNFTFDTYGRFWLQFPFNNYLRNYSFYSNVNFVHSGRYYEDLLFEIKNNKPFYDVQKLDQNKLNFSHYPYGALRTNPKRFKKFPFIRNRFNFRFFVNDPLYNLSLTKSAYNKKLDYIASFPWFMDRTRIEVLGSDFTYLDLDFVEDIPEDNEFSDNPILTYEFNNYRTGHYFKHIIQRRSGSSRSSYVPPDGMLDGFSFEETDWDVGSLVSFSSDDINSHFDEFSEKFDIFLVAVKDFYDLVKDYSVFVFYIKFRRYFIVPFKYLEISSSVKWLDFATRYGIWVLLFRNFFSFTFSFILFIYGFFVISRIFYYFFGEYFAYGWLSFFLFITTFFYIVLLLRFFFKGANDFYKSFGLGEKIELLAFITLVWYSHILNGYLKSSSSVWTSFTPRRLISNNYEVDFRVTNSDWNNVSGFTHRPELNFFQGRFFRKGITLKGRYYPVQRPAQFASLETDRDEFFYNLNIASYSSTIFNPKNFYYFIKFHFFSIRNNNFIGYNFYRRYVDRDARKVSLKAAHAAFHRPANINWRGIDDPKHSDLIKENILTQGIFAIISPNPYKYKAVTSDRKLRRSTLRGNPVNRRPYSIGPYSTLSKPKSKLPYDFRSRFITNDYYQNRSFKFNSTNYVTSSYFLPFNKNFFGVEDYPPIIYPGIDISKFWELPYPNKLLQVPIEKRERKERDIIHNFNSYTDPFYKNLNTNYYNFKDYSFCSRSVYNYWVQSKVLERHFNFNYSNNFRRYMFFYNPYAALSYKDFYGLNLQDVFPYGNNFNNPIPEFFYISEYQRKLLLAITKLERFESAKIIIFKSASNTFTKNYFPRSIHTGSIGYDYYADYEKFYANIAKGLYHLSPADTVPYPQKIEYYFYLLSSYYKNHFNYALSKLRISAIDKNSDFFKLYISNFNKSAVYNRLDFTERNSFIQSDVDYVNWVSNSNRSYRAKSVINYFRSLKAVNKQIQRDYYRESISYINPSFINNFLQSVSFESFKQGHSTVSSQNVPVHDPFYMHTDKEISYYSRIEDRSKIAVQDVDYFNPVFNNARINRLEIQNPVNNASDQSKYFKTSKDLFDNITFWDIFLDIIIVRDLSEKKKNLEELELKEDIEFFPPEENEDGEPYRIHYQYDPYNFEYDNRSFMKPQAKPEPKVSKKKIKGAKSGKSKEIVPVINEEEIEIGEKARVRSKPRERQKVDTSFSEFVYSVDMSDESLFSTHKDLDSDYDSEIFESLDAEYEGAEELENHYPRYRYGERLHGVVIPNVNPDQLNFRRSNVYASLKFDKWVKRNSDPTKYVRNSKLYFGSRIVRKNHSHFRKIKKLKPLQPENRYLYKNFMFQFFLFLNLHQRRRMLSSNVSNNFFPYNQVFIDSLLYGDDYVREGMEIVGKIAPKRGFTRRNIQRYFYPRRNPYNFLQNPDTLLELFDDDRWLSKGYHFSRASKRYHDLLKKCEVYNEREALKERLVVTDEDLSEFAKSTLALSTYYQYLGSTGVFYPDEELKEKANEKREITPEEEEEYRTKGDEEKGFAQSILLRAENREAIVYLNGETREPKDFDEFILLAEHFEEVIKKK